MDPYTNFAYATVQAGSSVIGSGGNPVTIILETGRGADFPGGDGATQFDVLLWPSDERPLKSNAEFIRVTRAGDTLTSVARAQQSTSALSGVALGYQVAAGMSAKLLDQIITSVGAVAQSWAMTGVISPPALTANQDNYNPTGLATASLLRLTSDATRSITGMAGVANGRILKLINVGTQKIILVAEGGSTAANRFSLEADLCLWPNDSASIWYDSASSRWRLESKSRGEPPGKVSFTGSPNAPSGHLIANGLEALRATYPALYLELNPIDGPVTITIGSPATITKASHGYRTGDSVFLTSTGTLPTGLSQNFRYWITVVTADTFRLSLSRALALSGANLNTSGSQSGIHTLYRSPHGIGDGSTTFNVPDMQSRVTVGAASQFGALGEITLGNSDGLALGTRSMKHNHTHTLMLPTHVHNASLTLPDHSHGHTLALPDHVHDMTGAGASHTHALPGSTHVASGSGSNVMNDTGISATQTGPASGTGGSIGNPTTHPLVTGAIGGPTTSPAIVGSIGAPSVLPSITGGVGPGGAIPVIDSAAYIVLTPIIKT